MAKESKRRERVEDAVTRASRAERQVQCYQSALNFVLRDETRGAHDKVIRWFENEHWRLGVCPEQPAGRVAVVFDWTQGRAHRDGSRAGEWRAEWLADLQAWRRDVFPQLPASLSMKSLVTLLDRLFAILEAQTPTAAIGRVDPPPELPAVDDDPSKS